ncbi:uncharacterized protein F54H12.2-like [Frankliniella occidentalis]|uniref:Uncharacterized protein F54H12.2-like n=1 Tax=Frankliniella occidentalis TaxID=133901 RepID=A0A6J1T6Q4_FRAOC|nr:uncharacterized protein F54H12.2-like [Frankliniella occidentalis]
MSVLHPNVGEAMLSETDLWGMPLAVQSVIKSTVVSNKPTTTFAQSNNLTFHVPGTSDCTDTNFMLHLSGEVVKADGTKIKEGESDVALVNNSLHSLLMQIDVLAGDTVVSQSSLTYPYKAYMEDVLAYDTNAKLSHMTMRGWAKDTAGHMDDYDGDNNQGLVKRRKIVKNSRVFEFFGPLHCDFLSNQGKLLLPHLDVTIKLTRTADSFALMSTTQNEKIVIRDATLFVRKVTLSPSMNIAHAEALEHAPARYPFTRTSVKSITIPSGFRDKTIPNVHLGQVPKRIVVGFVSNVAYNGSYHHNPFNFQHFNINYLCLYVDSDQIPAVPLTPDFTNGNYARSFYSLFEGTGIKWKDEGNDISYDEYGNGYTLFAFDLTPDQSAHEQHWNVQRQGVVRLDVRFKVELPVAVNCIVYSEFDNLIEIDKNRKVIVDYSV